MEQVEGAQGQSSPEHSMSVVHDELEEPAAASFAREQPATEGRHIATMYDEMDTERCLSVLTSYDNNCNKVHNVAEPVKEPAAEDGSIEETVNRGTASVCITCMRNTQRLVLLIHLCVGFYWRSGGCCCISR